MTGFKTIYSGEKASVAEMSHWSTFKSICGTSLSVVISVGQLSLIRQWALGGNLVGFP